MSYFAVIREAGPAWNAGGIADQPAMIDHSAFMDSLAAKRFGLVAGPLAGTEHGHPRALVTINAETGAGRRHGPEPGPP